MASCSCQPPEGLFHVSLSRKRRHSPAQQSDGGGSGVDSSIPAQSSVVPFNLVPKRVVYSLGLLTASESHMLALRAEERGWWVWSRGLRAGDGGKPGQGPDAQATGQCSEPHWASVGGLGLHLSTSLSSTDFLCVSDFTCFVDFFCQ